MKLKLITTLKYHWSKILSVFIFIILLGAYANIFAIGSPYSPGSTLNPECAPGEENCRVDTFQAEEDPTVSTYIKGITESYFTNGNTAYSWGDHSLAGYIKGVSSSDITTALGYTPYNSTNPSNYISDAPSDSLLYARRNGAWTTFTVPTTYSWSYTVKDDGWINLVDNGKIVHFNSNDDSLDITTSLSPGHWYINSEVADDGHSHTSSSISGLSVSDFTSPNISNWTNNANYITDGNTNWDNSYGFLTSYTETDPIFTAWDKDYADLINTPTIPTNLSDLSDDTTHRTVTDTEKSTWSGKQDALTSGTNIKTINSLSILGSGDLTVGLTSDADFNTKGGTSAGLNLVSGAQYNTFLGYEAGLSSATLSTNNAGYNTAIGYRSLYSNTTGFSNTANGSSSLRSNTTGYFNTANGDQSLYSNTTGSFNTANGSSSLRSNTTGSNNTANGSNSLYSNTTGSYNTANGDQSLYFNTTGYQNIANGFYSLRSNTTGYQNTANGSSSLRSNTTGFNNTANGYQSLLSNTTGSFNTANGNYSLYSNTTGWQNTANGYSSLYYSGRTVTAGSFITGVSYTIKTTGTTDFTLCGASNSTAGTVFTATGPCSGTGTASSNSNNNVAEGSNAGSYIANGSTALNASSNSIFLGADTKALIDGSENEIVIGYNATGNGSNTVTIGNSSLLRTYLTGVNLKAGSATAGTAPLKFASSGVNILTTPEEGAMEYDGTNLYFTPTGTTRRTVAYTTDIPVASPITIVNSSNLFSTGLGGSGSGTTTSNSFFLGVQSGQNSTNASNSNFLGYQSGMSSTNASNSNFFGYQAGYIAYGAPNSNFLGYRAGYNAESASNSNFLGYQAGYLAHKASNSIFIGQKAGYNDSADNTATYDDITTFADTSILIGYNTSTGGNENSIAIGAYATNTASNQFMIGSVSRPINSTIWNTAGGTTCTLESTGLTCTSDKIFKTNIHVLSDNTDFNKLAELDSSSIPLQDMTTLEKLISVIPVKYDWKENKDAVYYFDSEIDPSNVGFIAQNLEQYFPELVFTDVNGNKSVNYANMTPLLVEAIKEMNLKLEKINEFEVDEEGNEIVNSWRDSIVSWLANISNGIEEIFTKKITTEEVCIKKSDGTDFCINGDQLEEVVNKLEGDNLDEPKEILDSNNDINQELEIESEVDNVWENEPILDQIPPEEIVEDVVLEKEELTEEIKSESISVP